MLEPLAERLSERHLHGQDERITQQQDAPFVRGLRTQLFVVAESGAVDRDIDRELRRREVRARVRLEPESDHRIVFEEALERRRGLGAAPQAQRRLEHAELRETDEDERRCTAGGHVSPISAARSGERVRGPRATAVAMADTSAAVSLG